VGDEKLIIISVAVRGNTTTVLQPLYRSTCISRHLQLRTGGFCWYKVYCPNALADGNQSTQIREKTLEFSSTALSLHCLRTFTALRL